MTSQENRPGPGAAPAWSAEDRMNELETTMWRSERHPQHSSTICSLIILDCVPEWERLVAAHEWATTLVPRSRQRVLEPLLPTGPPVWRVDRHFALSYHLRRMHQGPDGSMAALMGLVQTLALTPFDRSRPLWEGTLIEGLEGGRAAYLLKLHHSLTDGLGAIQLMSLVQSRTREHTPDKPTRLDPSARGASAASAGRSAGSGSSGSSGSGATQPGYAGEPGDDDALGVTVAGARHTLAQLPAALAAGADAGISFARNPSRAAGEALRFAASLRRVLSPPPAPPSPLLRPRDGRVWVLRTLECPLAQLRTAAKRAGGSVNDAYLAALLGGLRRYHERHGVDIDEIPITVPVSLRRSDDPMGGNKFAGAMLSAPIGIVDPAERVAALRGAILAQLAEPALDSFSVLTPVVNRLPSAVGAAVMGLGAVTDLSASNMPGLTYDVYMAGARVERVFPFGPLPGVAMMAAMVSHVGTCCIGLTIDGTGVKDVDVLMESMQEGLEEVLAIAR
jgi:diacylglycerol O-acyltransferase